MPRKKTNSTKKSNGTITKKSNRMNLQNFQPSTQTSNLLIILLVAALSFLTGYLVCKVKSMNGSSTTAGPVPTTAPQVQGAQAVNVTMDQVKALFKDSTNIKFGDENRKVLFVEDADPSCPYCTIAGGENPTFAKSAGAQFTYDTDGGSYIPPIREMRKLVDEGKASFVWKYTNGHGSGYEAAEAFYCANEQGKFWQAHDKMMSNAGYELLNTKLEKDANGTPLINDSNTQMIVDFLSTEVDGTALKSCLDSKKYEKKLASDEQEAPAIGFRGTPHMLVNTSQFPGAYSYSEMKPIVDAALK